MLGERLKFIRKANKVRQEDLADIIGMKKSTISLYETNRTDPSDLTKVEIAKYFNISLDYLMGVIAEPVPFYKEDLFIALPKGFGVEDRKFICDFVQFIDTKRKL